jgi:hypothetical protein
LKVGNHNDREDARKLSELLYLNRLSPVFHGETGIRTLRELARSYLTITRDLTRVMNRLKAIYRGWGIPCAGQQVYAPRYRAEWFAKITEAGVRRRAEIYYQQFGILATLRQEIRRELRGAGQGVGNLPRCYTPISRYDLLELALPRSVAGIFRIVV